MKSAWPRLCLKADFDAIYIKKVKVHTPWAPKNDKELKLKVGGKGYFTVLFVDIDDCSLKYHSKYNIFVIFLKIFNLFKTVFL